jgi:hypothetical protein
MAKEEFDLIAISPGVFAKARKPKPVIERAEPDDEPVQERRPPCLHSNPRGYSLRDTTAGSGFREYDREERQQEIYSRALAALRTRPVNLEGFNRADRARVETAILKYFDREATSIAKKCVDDPSLYDMLLSSVIPFDKVLDNVEQVQYADESKAAYLAGGHDPDIWMDPITEGKNNRYWRETPDAKKPELMERLQQMNIQNALKFKEEHPEYYSCEENSAAFAEYCDRHGIKYFAPVMIQFIVSRLRTFGSLKEKPVVNLSGIGPFVPNAEDEQRIREEEVAEERRKYFHDKTFLVDADGRGYSESDVDQMSSEDLGKLLPRINTTARVCSHNLGGI